MDSGASYGELAFLEGRGNSALPSPFRQFRSQRPFDIAAVKLRSCKAQTWSGSSFRPNLILLFSNAMG